MKCPICGREYPDSIKICPFDRVELEPDTDVRYADEPEDQEKTQADDDVPVKPRLTPIGEVTAETGSQGREDAMVQGQEAPEIQEQVPFKNQQEPVKQESSAKQTSDIEQPVYMEAVPEEAPEPKTHRSRRKKKEEKKSEKEQKPSRRELKKQEKAEKEARKEEERERKAQEKEERKKKKQGPTLEDEFKQLDEANGEGYAEEAYKEVEPDQYETLPEPMIEKVLKGFAAAFVLIPVILVALYFL